MEQKIEQFPVERQVMNPAPPQPAGPNLNEIADTTMVRDLASQVANAAVLLAQARGQIAAAAEQIKHLQAKLTKFEMEKANEPPPVPEPVVE